MMNQSDEFRIECKKEIEALADNKELRRVTHDWMCLANTAKYSYHFEWMGRPIIQYPQDIMAMQEIIWTVKPDLIIETGIAHGGSLIFSASILELNAACGGPPDAEILGLDIDIRPHNREAIINHPMSKRITMLQGSSIDMDIIKQVYLKADGKKSILVSLDSNHTHQHVIQELEAYAPLVTVGSYCVVFDTIIEDLPSGSFFDRPWDRGDNPKTAVWEYLKTHREFEVDKSLCSKLLISVAPDGFLKRIQ